MGNSQEILAIQWKMTQHKLFELVSSGQCTKNVSCSLENYPTAMKSFNSSKNTYLLFCAGIAHSTASSQSARIASVTLKYLA